MKQALVGFQAGVRFPALLFMKKSRGLVLGIVAVLVVGAGSASVLDSFGSISGTADVEQALNITSVDNTSSDSEAYVKIDVKASEVPVSRVEISDSEEDAFDPFADGPEFVTSNTTVIVTGEEVDSAEVQEWFDEEIVHFTSGDSAVGGGLDERSASGDTVRLKIDETIVDSLEYGGDSSE